ncbi:MAG: DEAD/DEAH box helicase, partial [Bacteroidota bacterium]
MDTPERITRFADILLPVPLPRTFTYRVPVAMEGSLAPMLRVIVPFGPKKILTGLVIRIHETPPADHEAKSILEVLDVLPVFNELQVKLFNWMADYYMCTAGEVLNAGMPSGLKLSSESLVQISPSFNFDEPSHPMSEKEWAVLHRIRHETIAYADLSKSLGIKNLHNILKSLRLKEAVIILEEVREKYQPKVEKRVRFTAAYCSKSSLEQYFSTLKSGSKQEEVLIEMLHRLPVFHDPEANTPGVAKSVLVKETGSDSVLKTLIKKGVIEEFQTIVSRFPDLPPQPDKMPSLSAHQQDALQAVMESFKEDKPVLLHGITGSGKTELYITLIRKALDGGGQALLLLPEIALTTQIVIRLRRVFGKELGIYHSRFSDNERVEVWSGVAAGLFRVV